MEYPLTDDWFVLRDLTRPNAKRPAYRLLEEKGIEIFTPMRWRLVERKGKRIREEVPLLHDLLFAHTPRTCMDPIVEEISTLQYRYLRGGYRKPMTVGHAEMNRFICAVHSDLRIYTTCASGYILYIPLNIYCVTEVSANAFYVVRFDGYPSSMKAVCKSRKLYA